VQLIESVIAKSNFGHKLSLFVILPGKKNNFFTLLFFEYYYLA